MTTEKTCVGLLGFYLELYDRSVPGARPRIESFYRQIADALRALGLNVLTAPVCRLEREFRAAIASFERGGAEALFTLHLAYSPSLESAGALAATDLPVIVLDTTPTFDYGPEQNPAELMFNHGIHGVQDMCNLLLRNGKPFKIEAGHWLKSDMLRRAAAWAPAARMAAAMRRARIGRIGAPFKGMGDFAVPPAAIKRTIGCQTVPCPAGLMRKSAAGIRRGEEAAEIALLRRRFDTGGLDPKVLRCSARAGLAVRRWIEREKLTGFTVNFLEAGRGAGLPAVPFLEACLGMERGLGYAGEGDVLTAALVGALASACPATTFTEMFCPDWKGNSIFLSHMGEVNPAVLRGKPRLVEVSFKFSSAPPPARVAGCLRGGPAVFVNLAPLPGNRFRLIAAPVEMPAPRGRDRAADSVRGWFRPRLSVPDFLEEYSRLGGTHHAALVYGGSVGDIAGFGDFMGWQTVALK